MKEKQDERLTYLQRISYISGIPVEYLQKFRDLGYMNELAVRNSMIRYEYLRMKDEEGTVKSKMAKLRERYNIDVKQLQNIVANHIKKDTYYCKYCGRKIQSNRYFGHDHTCKQCSSNPVKL